MKSIFWPILVFAAISSGSAAISHTCLCGSTSHRASTIDAVIQYTTGPPGRHYYGNSDNITFACSGPYDEIYLNEVDRVVVNSKTNEFCGCMRHFSGGGAAFRPCTFPAPNGRSRAHSSLRSCRVSKNIRDDIPL
ncbi:MAG: hypothetical protein J3R72DRAFT_448243 [Linnemannia gamsii]|nr:MAG: hypothetical protein J3R72DRAFT_448243 [Linnemannia gamsii]